MCLICNLSQQELFELLRSEEGRLAREVSSLQAQLTVAQQEMQAQRSHNAALQRQLEDMHADLREERVRSQELGNALATAMRQLKDPASSNEAYEAMSAMVAATTDTIAGRNGNCNSVLPMLPAGTAFVTGGVPAAV